MKMVKIKKVPRMLQKGALAIGGGITIVVVIVVNTFNSD
jgi:hypothetical protein